MRNGRLLVLLQFALLAALVVPWGGAAFGLAGLVPLLLSAAVGGWTLAANPPSNFSVFPEPRARARLVTDGPYRVVRHPMYVAVLLFAAGFAIGYRTLVHAALLVVLALVLHAKATIEERRLAQRFPEYDAYCRRTARWIPLGR